MANQRRHRPTAAELAQSIAAQLADLQPANVDVIAADDWAAAKTSLATDHITILHGTRQPAFDLVRIAFYIQKQNAERFVLAYSRDDMLLASASPISIVLRQETGGKVDNRVKLPLHRQAHTQSTLPSTFKVKMTLQGFPRIR